MSFSLTTDQVRRRQKTVTRRIGWADAKPGQLVQPVIKTQGLKKGEHVEQLGGPIRIVSVRRERLDALLTDSAYGAREVDREGFGGHMTPRMFVDFFCASHGCVPRMTVTRIEFEYVEAAAGPAIESPPGGRT